MALAAERLLTSRGPKRVRLVQCATGQTFYKGSMVIIDSSGLAIPAAAAAGNGGIAGISCQNLTTTANGDYLVIEEGEFLLVASGMAQARVGEFAYASDDETVVADASAATNTAAAGLITEYLSATSVWVQMSWIVSVQRGAHA